MKKVLFLSIFTLFLAGCEGSPVQTGLAASKNKRAMVNVQPDMTVDEVSKIMGSPHKTEFYRGKNNEEVLVYFYITEGMDMYTRKWDERNLTPFVFVNKRLHGWGWPNLESAAQKYEFIIKER
jgi:outer membrane protein assembly factor BamE (lipoprotein component of BamABCDE complex)